METKVTIPKRNYVVGTRPVHNHKCPDGHFWECNSPYCDNLEVECPEHGGFEPIVQGREQWRGR